MFKMVHLNNTFKFIRNFYCPYLNLDYYLLYFKFWQEIAINKNLRYSLLIYFINFNLVFETLHYFYLGISKQNEIGNLIRYNLFYILVQKQEVHFMTACGALGVCIMVYIFYMKGEKYCYFILYQVIFQNKTKVYFINPFYKNKLIVIYLKTIATNLLIFFKFFMIITCK